MGNVSPGFTRVRVLANEYFTKLSPHEAVAADVCQELAGSFDRYVAAFSFGTPDGDDLDLRLCFRDLSQEDEIKVSQAMLSGLRDRGVDLEVDLLFMDVGEFRTGIRDLDELGYVEERLIDGFDPHIRQGAVGDTSLFSRFIFSSMRPLDITPEYDPALMGSPNTALKQLPITSEGAVGWSHFYTGCFLDTYLRYPAAEKIRGDRYQERVAKFFSRVVLGSTLAQTDAESLAEIGPLLTDAIRNAGAHQSTDGAMSAVIIDHPNTSMLLDDESRQLLHIAGKIRNGEQCVDAAIVSSMESRLFYEAFQQGAHRRKTGENTDSLAAYALTELLRDVGKMQVYPPAAQLTWQGHSGKGLYFLPLKNSDTRANPGILIEERHGDGTIHRIHKRPPGRLIGEAALFGATSSASVFIDSDSGRGAEGYFLDIKALGSLLTNPKTRQQLQQPLLETCEARRLDVLLRYFAREAGLFNRRILPYTHAYNIEESLQPGDDSNPLAPYNLGMKFHDTLHYLAMTSTSFQEKAFVTLLSNRTKKEVTLFETGATNPYLYVVSRGAVPIKLQTGEELLLNIGEYFGESSLLGLPASGTAVLPPETEVIRVQGEWFMRFTQSRQPLPRADTSRVLRPPLPVHLLYHLAAVGYDRVRNRLLTQRHPEAQYSFNNTSSAQ